MKIAATLSVLALSTWSAMAGETPQDGYQKLIESYGFEFRPKQEVPWGTPISPESRMKWIELGERKVRIDEARALNQQQLQRFMLDHILKYGVREVELTSALLLGTKVSYAPSLADVFASEEPVSIYPPPVSRYVARLPALKISDREYSVRCVFMFVKLGGDFFPAYFYRNQYQSYDSSWEPNCDMH